MPQAGFDPPGEKWQLCVNIVVEPPKPPRLDEFGISFKEIKLRKNYLCSQRVILYKKKIPSMRFATLTHVFILLSSSPCSCYVML